MTAPEADGWDELDLPGMTVTIVDGPPPLPGVPSYAIRKWENHGLKAGTHRLVAEPLARREVEAARLNRGGDEGAAGVRQDNAGEGEAPVAWLIPGVERDMVELDGSAVVSEASARGFEVHPLFTRPTPATPAGEGLVADLCEMHRLALRVAHARPDNAGESFGARDDLCRAADRLAHTLLAAAVRLDPHAIASRVAKALTDQHGVYEDDEHTNKLIVITPAEATDAILAALQPQAQPAALSPETDR